MSALVFKLRNVPEDEATDIRELLSRNNIDYYETSAGNWGASLPAIWVKDRTQSKHAIALIEQYEDERAQQARQDYLQQKAAGNSRTLLDVILHEPLRLLAYAAVIAFILYFSLRLVTDFAG
ncbi:MAG TPA: hypothetical protein ENJ64_02610 [Thiotrichales bacterium]|nr:hypothetical protein [Thiotrichales bacterium]